MSSTALSATRFSIAALAFAPYVWRGLKLPHVRRSAAELALWLLGGLTLQCLGCMIDIVVGHQTFNCCGNTQFAPICKHREKAS